jgi:endonuclease-3
LNNSIKANETRIRRLVEVAGALFPDARCELDHTNVFELTIAVILSAQTTDPSVNKVTPVLFQHYPDPQSMAQADIIELESMIKSIGLYRSKAKHIKALSRMLIDEYDGKIPDDFDELQKLPGIGRKTANVIVAVGFHQPGLAVDTHVLRVSQRLGLVPINADPNQTEMILKKALPKEQWGDAHHAILFFGRYHCLARSPKCELCPLKEECPYHKKTSR